ncbi:carbohydrate ABC transporter permease [Paenibacillus albiflavus]|uniref:carbohydrate ABC transporter permease n=1 Tax=Paenibacillus albiflavus TaxID=2545760 RepID=UPI001F19F3F2|nr:sugar ABC transporter permease [Paenibacillus albiflavus]
MITLRTFRNWREISLAYTLLAPSIILFTIFLFYPMFKSLYLSLHLTDPRGNVALFVGLNNFKEIFSSPAFYQSLKITLLFMLLTVPTVILLALLLAAFTHHQARGMKLFQWIYSLPVILSVGTSSVIWAMLYHPSTGILNHILHLVGIDPIFWLTDPAWALISVSIMTIWMNLGFTYIVILGGLKGIPSEILESARLDGAGGWRIFITICIPLLSPALFFVTIISIIGSFQAFGQIKILTKGGPAQATDVIVNSIYQDAFVNFQFGSGSAKALVLFAIILLLTFIQFRFIERKVHYQ